jgi:O-antigen/teichoic acid export membrane protein
MDRDTRRWGKMLKCGAPLFILTFAGGLSQNLGLVLLEFFGNAHEVGIFAGGLRLVMVVWSLVAMVPQCALPTLVRKGQEAPEKNGTVWLRGAAILSGCATILAVMVFVFARFAVEKLLGPEYAGSAATARLLVWYVPLDVFVQFGGATLMASNQEWVATKRIFIGIVVLVLTSGLLIPTMGRSGAALSMIAGALVTAIGIAISLVQYTAQAKHGQVAAS